jgi:hypothetical protein
LILSLNLKNLKRVERQLFDHQLIYLNPNYKDAGTPANYRDWLDLIYESIHHPDNPAINFQNDGIRRVAEIVSYENITPEEWEQAKIEASKRRVITLERQEERLDIAKNLKAMGIPNEAIAKATGLWREEISEL